MSDELDDLIRKRRQALATATAQSTTPKDALDDMIAQRRQAVQPSQFSPGEKFATAIAQGASLGFGKKILGGIDAANKMLPHALGGEGAPLSDFGKNYTATRDRIGAVEAEALREHPVAGRAVEIGAGALPALVGGLITKAPAVLEAAPMGVRMLKSAFTGAGVGAVGGAGHATGDLSDYGREMAQGAGTGFVLGGLIPPVATGISRVGGKALTTLNLRPTGRSAQEMAADNATLRAPQGPESNTPTAESIRNPLPSTTPTPTQRVRATFGRTVENAGIESAKTRALRQVMQRMEDDNVSPADAVAFAERNASKPLAVLDLGNENVASLARLSKDTPGLGKRLIPKLLHERSAGTAGNEGATLSRVTGDIEQRIGLSPEDYYASLDEMIAKQKAQAAHDYGAIRGKMIDDPEVLSLFDEPEFQAIHKRLRDNARLGGKEKIPELYTVENIDGEEVRSLNPQTLGVLDKMKRQLDKIVAGKSEAVGTVDRDLAYNMRERIKAILDRMDEVEPQYGHARANYRGSQEAIDAYEAGKAEFLSLDPRAIRAKLAKMPEAVRDFYRRGGYDALRANKLTKMEDGANIGAFLEKNPDIRDRVAALAKAPESAQALRGDLAVERAMGDRKNFILGGPNTAERFIDYLETQPKVTNPVQGGIKGMAGRAVEKIGNRTIREGTRDVMGEVGKLMTRSGPEGVKLTMQDIAALRDLDIREKIELARKAGLIGGSTGANARKR